MRTIRTLILALALLPLGCGGDDEGGGGDPTLHDMDVVADETWALDGSPHIVDGCLYVGGTSVDLVTLTIEAGAEVRFTAGGCLIVGDADMRGALMAEGSELAPILFTSNQADGSRTAGYWDGIIFGEDADVSCSLDHVTVEYGGAVDTGAHSGPNWVDAMLIAWGDGAALPVLSIKNTTVRHSATDGMVFESGARFAAGSEGLVVESNAGYPVHIEAEAAHTLPTDAASDYTGNGDDVIFLLDGNGYELASGTPTWTDPGVPYLIGNNVWVNGADWTIASGVTVASVAGGEIEVSDGTLTANMVTFTSRPGTSYWGGIYFDPPGTGSLIDSIIERGGSNYVPNSDGFNIYVEAGTSALPTISGCTIRDSLHDGIATWDTFPVAYQSNTFTGNADWDMYDYFNDLGWNQ